MLYEVLNMSLMEGLNNVETAVGSKSEIICLI